MELIEYNKHYGCNLRSNKSIKMEGERTSIHYCVSDMSPVDREMIFNATRTQEDIHKQSALAISFASVNVDFGATKVEKS